MSNAVLSIFDDLGEASFYRHNLKKAVNKANVELEKFSNDVWNQMTPDLMEKHMDTQEKFNMSVDVLINELYK